ncbi:MAG: sigma-54-dependent transcriptional regulator [Bacteroidales bacterium]
MANKEGSILIVDDNDDLLIALKLFLSRHFNQLDTLRNPNLIPSLLQSSSYDLILLDMNFRAGTASGNEGIYLLHQILETDPDASVVFITAFGDVELAVRSMKEGAADFIMKSWDEQKILSTVLAAYQLRKRKLEVSLLKKKQAHLSSLIEQDLTVCHCQSPAMRELSELIEKVADTGASVLILGENGTGKEVIAREIHRRSSRRKEIFVKVDLGAIPETLFESELFGHRKGAFTDAKEDRDGRFMIASGGTLFLDEIGNLPLSLQGKLLSVIQNREIYPVGSSRPHPVDVRIISATNMPLADMVTAGGFREDLLYRINAIQVEVPPLRDRKEDIPLLARFFLIKYRTQYRKDGLEMTERVIRDLMEHSWPGNIRELEHVIEKAVILSDGSQMTPEDLFSGGSGNAGTRIPDTLNLDENEKILIDKALRKEKGNVSAAAKKLGINRSTLYQKMKKYGL